MANKLKSLSLVFIALLLFSVVSFASYSYRITYDYGVADIRSESIINTNPRIFSNIDIINLTDAQCPGFEFKGWYLEPDYKTQVTTVDTSVSSDITLYAKWYEMTYSINYVLETPGIGITADDITHLNPTSRLASETTYISAPVSNTDIYTFDGWYSDSNYTKKVEFIDEYTCSDMTLYAHWTNTRYSLYYELGDVVNSVYTTDNPNPSGYEYSQEIILADAVTNDPSYSFDGWYSDEFFTKKITSIPAGTSGNIVLYAKWNKTVYNIGYVLADESGIDIKDIHNSNPETRTVGEDINLSEPVSDDKTFKFDGWYTSPDFSKGSAITFIPSDLREDITIYAKWTTAVYKIRYDYGNISLLDCPIDNKNPESYEFGDSITLEDVEADGFIFNGWCTDKALKNKITEIPAGTYGDITIYADFTEKTYSITYVLDGKEITASQVVNLNPTVRTTTQQISLVDAETINSEYTFDGWYHDSEFTKDVEYIRSYTTGNITLYAKWIKIVVYLPCWGDATLSAQLSAADARLILRYSAGLETGFTDLQKRVADINNDEQVNAADARLALRLSANIDKESDLINKYSLPEITIKDGEVVFK